MSYNMNSVRDFAVQRTTAEKLQDDLNEMSEVFDELEPVFTGGRDWIIVASRERTAGMPEHPFGNVGRRPNGATVRVP